MQRYSKNELLTKYLGEVYDANKLNIFILLES